jgi:hypothetical protein
VRVLAQPLKFALLQDSQQLRLHVERNIPDFVQEQGAFVCELEPAWLSHYCASKGALLVSEQFALQQPGGNSRAVQLDERSITPCASIVNGLGDQLFPGTRFSLNQHAGVGWSHNLHLSQYASQGQAPANDVFKNGIAALFMGDVSLALVARLALQFLQFRSQQAIRQAERHLVRC